MRLGRLRARFNAKGKGNTSKDELGQMTIERLRQKPVKLDRLVEMLKEQDDEIKRLREALQSTSTMIELMCKVFDLSPEDFVINVNASKENGETRVVRSISAQEVLDKVRATLGEKE